MFLPFGMFGGGDAFRAQDVQQSGPNLRCRVDARTFPTVSASLTRAQSSKQVRLCSVCHRWLGVCRPELVTTIEQRASQHELRPEEPLPTSLSLASPTDESVIFGGGN